MIWAGLVMLITGSTLMGYRWGLIDGRTKDEAPPGWLYALPLVLVVIGSYIIGSHIR